MKSELISIRPDARKESNGCHGELEREEWRDVVGYEGYYQVSSFGRVRSVDRVVRQHHGNLQHKKGRVMFLRKTKDGYPILTVSKNGAYKKQVRVHRLVMEAFVPNPDNLPVVNHRNEDKAANYPDNMEWCTVKYNNTYGTVLQRLSNKLKGRKHTQERIENIRKSKQSVMTPVLQFTPDGVFVAEYMSQAEAGRLTGCNQRHIYSCCRGKRKTTGGFVWRYK